jgi:hypothetical protein
MAGRVSRSLMSSHSENGTQDYWPHCMRLAITLTLGLDSLWLVLLRVLSYLLIISARLSSAVLVRLTPLSDCQMNVLARL